MSLLFILRDTQEEVDFDQYDQIEFEGDLIKVNNTWDIFSKNDEAIREDFELLTDGRKSQPIPETVQYVNKADIFIEEGAELSFCNSECFYRPHLYW